MATHLFDGVQQPSVAVDHDQDRDPQTENEQTDDVRVRTGRVLGPADRAAGPSPLQTVTAPAQQGRYRPEQGVQPGSPHSQQGLPEVRGPLVAHHQGAVAVVGQDGQRDQRHDP